MKETEVKFLEINAKAIETSLIKIGAKKIFDGYIYGERYDFKDRRLMKAGKLLRLRKKGDKAELTFKIPISQDKAKVAEELESEVDDMNAVGEILRSLGISCVKKYKKKRISYKLGKVRFEIDTCPGIPTFLEIEAQSAEMIEEYAKKIGLDMKDAKPWTGAELMKHYK